MAIDCKMAWLNTEMTEALVRACREKEVLCWLFGRSCCFLLDGEVFLDSESDSLAHLDVLVHTVLAAGHLDRQHHAHGQILNNTDLVSIKLRAVCMHTHCYNMVSKKQ